eukprot:TRINITY_DN16571_c0_g1_i1.p1 TRINITY_DN16571_c0_g1~~TRINITY_DN16571_c0_g1_i1.p1  ORF type:complete len:208 (-),score=35.31 TRINITY_DN16571_c0_g1_i1:5-628(-)
MKFRFCGDLDAPDWLLREITVLVKISSVRIKFIVKEIIESLLGGSLDYEKLFKHTATANLDASDVKATVAAISFIINNGAKYDVDAQVLTDELQQLGLPKEHCDALSKEFSVSKSALRNHLTNQTLKLTKLNTVDWRIDYTLATIDLIHVDTPSVQLKLNTTKPCGEHESLAFEVSDSKFKVLLTELQLVREMMDNVEVGVATTSES